MLRASLLWLSERQRLNRFVHRNRLASRFASRFVAGETVDTAMAALRAFGVAGISASLDLLGESVHKPDEARAARDVYLQLLDRIHAVGAEANVSVKLTQMGLDIDERLCVENLRAIIGRARTLGSFVRLDMEGDVRNWFPIARFERAQAGVDAFGKSFVTRGAMCLQFLFVHLQALL